MFIYHPHSDKTSNKKKKQECARNDMNRRCWIDGSLKVIAGIWRANLLDWVGKLMNRFSKPSGQNSDRLICYWEIEKLVHSTKCLTFFFNAPIV